MTDHPTTFRAEPTSQGIDWDDRASIHRKDDGDGLLDAFKGLHRGSLAEMVRLIRNMPEENRGDFVIQKAGDRKLEPDEIMALAEREDFPG
jgi:hypothetical protein